MTESALLESHQVDPSVSPTDPIEVIRNLQSQIEDGGTVIQQLRLHQQMEDLASDNQAVELVTPLANHLLSIANNAHDRKLIIINTLLLFGHPEADLMITELTQEIETIKGVSNRDVGILLGKIKEHLGVGRGSGLSLIRHDEQYPRRTK
jgi:hypothetical protein